MLVLSPDFMLPGLGMISHVDIGIEVKRPLQHALRGHILHRLCFSNPTLILLSVPLGVKEKSVGPISDVFIAVPGWLWWEMLQAKC